MLNSAAEIRKPWGTALLFCTVLIFCC